MASPQRTPFLALSCFSDNDKPSWIEDYNRDMKAIDAAYKDTQTVKTHTITDYKNGYQGTLSLAKCGKIVQGWFRCTKVGGSIANWTPVAATPTDWRPAIVYEASGVNRTTGKPASIQLAPDGSLSIVYGGTAENSWGGPNAATNVCINFTYICG